MTRTAERCFALHGGNDGYVVVRRCPPDQSRLLRYRLKLVKAQTTFSIDGWVMGGYIMHEQGSPERAT